jgi:transglutaminase-like putative cysteine protease
MALSYIKSYPPAEVKARELCDGIIPLYERYKAITKYVSENIVYDHVRKIKITKRNGLPNIERCWRLKMGICLDISALTVLMLRAVCVPCSLVIGWADGHYHAWGEARINGTKYLYDHDDVNGKIKVYKKERLY